MPKLTASASYQEVEKVLEDFMARHPGLEKDSSIFRGGKASEYVAGAIASMAFEGPLYEVMNNGTGNREFDKAVMEDLSKSLRSIGCYYEMGTDWSLGVFPLEEDSASDKLARMAIDELAEIHKFDPDDAESESLDYSPYDDGDFSLIKAGDMEFIIGEASDFWDAAKKAQLEAFDDGEYDLSSYVDREGLRKYSEEVFSEWASSEADDLDDQEKEAWLENQDLMVEGGDVDALFEENRSSWEEERVSDMLGTDGTGWDYWVDNFGDDEFNKMIVSQRLIDEDWAAEDLTSTAGDIGILGSYDGQLHELQGGKVAYIRIS